MILLVNKINKLNKNYIPKDLVKLTKNLSIKECYLRKQTYKMFKKMCKKATKNNLCIKAASCFRSYDYQNKIYNEYVIEKGEKEANRCSAKPGYSEHQTGMAIDIEGSTGTYDDFEKTREFKWVEKNAHKYGFILRYPKDKERITGYKYEPWHYRYVGIKVAKRIYKKKITLEEYLIF